MEETVFLIVTALPMGPSSLSSGRECLATRAMAVYSHWNGFVKPPGPPELLQPHSRRGQTGAALQFAPAAPGHVLAGRKQRFLFEHLIFTALLQMP